jgi:hypothetical protein
MIKDNNRRKPIPLIIVLAKILEIFTQKQETKYFSKRE